MARKRKTSRVRIKDKAGRREDDREMAISAINNKEVDKKSKMTSNNNSHENIVSNPTVSTQRSKEEEKEGQGKEKSTNSVNTSMSQGFSEVFDSSKYNVMTQMKNSSTMDEEKLKEISSNIGKIKPIEAETIDINNQPSSHIDVNASSAGPSTSNVDQSLEERAALLRGSKKEIMSDQNLVENKSIASRLEEEEKSRKVDVERQEQEYNPLNSFTSPYVSLWRESVNMWTNIYTESVRNTAKMSEYWLALFSKPWSGQYKQKYKDKVKVE